ncbi:Sulfate permease 2 [Cladobotryum mycophilum]|uniref:Sulfate permease 2 n=1 Tax=Cladobotryum mycophilum TaxID=491253 RepID=A0ABR0S853_9HYPO
MTQGKFSHFLTNKVLGIDVDERYSQQPRDLDRRARDALYPTEIYLEDEPTAVEWIKGLAPTRQGAIDYFQSLFPSAQWIRRYNFQWLLGDVVAGATIGMVVVPQAMAYAALAQLTPAYGLYTSFTGAVLYWLFGTSKDIVIGPTSVGALLVGQVVSGVSAAAPGQYTPEQIAHSLSMITGAIFLFFGLFRLGWIIEFIPYIPISAFVTAASITIMSTQIPNVLGIPGIDSKEAPYRVIYNTLRSLPNTQLDAAIGLSSIVLLFTIRGFCSKMEEQRPSQKRMWSLISSSRLTFTMSLFTLISYIVHRNTPLTETKFVTVGHIDPGFQHAHIPRPNTDLLGHILPQLPAVVIILVIEHIAIAKAMGRLHNYTINPSQEIMALGAANMFSPFVGGFVCTGSFGASAMLSKSGVRTPLASLFSAMVLILALYALTGVFYYIPKAAMAGLIIHAVYNLASPPKSLFRYWQLSPIELLIWVVGVAVAIFYTLEWCIYTGVILSFVVLLVRLAKTKGRFLALARVRRNVAGKGQVNFDPTTPTLAKSPPSTRVAFIPLDRKDASNPDVTLETPYPGVFVYRLSEGFNYTNQAYHVDIMSNYIMENSRRMSEERFEKESDRLWNDSGPTVYKDDDEGLPFLRAVVLDFAAVNNVDITSIQGLVELRNTFDSYSAPDTVEWHFASVHNRWTRRALAVAGFGYPTSHNPQAMRHWKPVYSITTINSKAEELYASPSQRTLDLEMRRQVMDQKRPMTSEKSIDMTDRSSLETKTEVEGASYVESRPTERMASISSVDRPFFHVDLHDAVDSAVRDAQAKDMVI